MADRALILVDIQNDYFEGGDWPVAGMEGAARNAAALLANARQAGDEIVHIRHEMPSDQAPFFRPGTAGAEIADAAAPLADETVLTKHRPNSFLGTGLLEHLRDRGVRRVTVCGAMSQMCIDATARAAADHGFEVTVVEDACGARDMEFGGVLVPADAVHAAFMAALGSSYGKVVGTAAYLAG